MKSEALRAAIETTHERLYPDSHATLFGMRTVELGELIVETVGVCEVDGFLAGHRHFVATLSTPKYTQLGQLFDEVPDAWALIDPQTVEPQDFVTNLDVFRLAFIEAFPERAAAAGVVDHDPADTPAATNSNVVQLRRNTKDAEITEDTTTGTALAQVAVDPFAQGVEVQTVNALSAHEATVRLWLRELAESNLKLVGELVQQRRRLLEDDLVSSHNSAISGKPMRPSRGMPNGALSTALEVFSRDGKTAAVDFFHKEFLYAFGGASPELLELIRQPKNTFLRELFCGRVDDADYGRYMGIFLEIIRDVLEPAA